MSKSDQALVGWYHQGIQHSMMPGDYILFGAVALIRTLPWRSPKVADGVDWWGRIPVDGVLRVSHC